ncbi:MAG: glycoside hydrolase family 2 TIM barrel-domain containing protein [Bacillota bacterium]
MNKRKRLCFDHHWKFCKGDYPEAKEPKFDDSRWEPLVLPHDWSIKGPFDKDHPTGGDGGSLPAGIGWYRKTFQIEETDRDSKIFIEFDGVYCNSEVWINGQYLDFHHNGYTGFTYDVTPYLNFYRDNVLSVRVNNSEQPGSRWYTGSGIYRHTWLVATDNVYIPYNGTYVTTPNVSSRTATVNIEVKTVNENSSPVDATLKTTILTHQNEVVGTVTSTLILEKNTESTYEQQLKITNPNLWSVENPFLYTARTEIFIDNNTIDHMETTFGIRSIHFDSDKGFFLNGEHVKINGVCLHHDGGCVGAAVPERVWERRLEILKEMGCNGIRMAHNPPSPELLDLCDKMGFLVMDEAFDEWSLYKFKNIADRYPIGKDKEFGYFKYFEENYEKDLLAMLHRDRNHPSIVMWSVGNEIPEQKEEFGYDLLKKMKAICHNQDPTRPVTVACDQIEAEPKNACLEFLEALDVVGYNYVNRWRTRTETYYTEDKLEHPHWKMIGSENQAIPAVRGEYSLPDAPTSKERTYYNNMIRTEQLWKFTKMHDYVAGDFMWTGIDYLGESRWPKKNASFAPLDLCAFPKDAYYFYQSQWTTEPMLHAFPHWNWEGHEGKVIPVLCYTNCDSVELFVNGKSFGEKCYEFPLQGMTQEWAHYNKTFLYPTTSDLHLSWDVPYVPGTIEVVGKKDGKIVLKKEVSTTGEPSKLRLSCDRSSIQADGRDVSHIKVEVLDENNLVVPTADNEITFTVEGDGQLIGVDNGNPESHESFQANTRKAFNGLALGILQSSKEAGKIKVVAEARGLESDEFTILTK